MILTRFLILFVFFLPGFGITFLIGWFRSRLNPNFLKITLWATLVGASFAAVVCAGFIALFFHMMGPNEIDHFTKPLTVEQARQQDCPIPLPDTARNVQYVYASGGLQALEILVRFEAPVEVCRAHVQTVADASARKNNWPLHKLPLTSLKSRPQPEDHDMVGRAPWFDVEDIKNGSTAGTGAEWSPEFWIDEDRGVFYCKITD
jgi:hypothetical protein